jgi:predicted helicase
VRKVGEKRGLGIVHHSEIFGKREDKFKTLNEGNLRTIKWKKLNYSEPYYFFVLKDFGLEEEYIKGFKIDELFEKNNSGVQTDRDSLFIDCEKEKLNQRIQQLLSNDYSFKFKNHYRVFDSSSYKITNKIKNKLFNEKFTLPIQYRPFDYQWIYYDHTIISRSGFKIYQHLIKGNNFGLIAKRGLDEIRSTVCFISKDIIDRRSWSRPGMLGAEQLFPLYLYLKDGSKIPNLKKETVSEIEKVVGKVSPEDIFDYIYAVLHSPKYREKYKEFLKIDFPRVPYPKEVKSFKKLVTFGAELRSLHLLESPKVNQFITTYPIAGSDTVEKLTYEDGKVFINTEQYFGNVPEVVWNFYIGGYQPARKWLKDRKGRILTNTDLEHYQKIIVVLAETNRIMKEIDKDAEF